MYKTISKYVQRSIEADASSHKGRRFSQRNLLRKIKPLTIHRGRVTKIFNHGAIVMIKGIETYLHISKIKKGYVKHPSQFLKINQRVGVMVLSKDYDGKGRLSIKVSMAEIDQKLMKHVKSLESSKLQPIRNTSTESDPKPVYETSPKKPTKKRTVIFSGNTNPFPLPGEMKFPPCK